MNEHEPEGGWAGPSAPRIRTPPTSNAGVAFRGMSIAARAFGRADVPDVFSVLHLHPRLFWGWLHFASRLMPFGRLDARERELMILRTAWNCRSEYEWGQHVDVGLGVGLDDEAIVRIRRGAGAAIGTRERTLLRACDELHRDRTLSEPTFVAIHDEGGDAAIIEITMLIGHYAMLAGFLTTAGITLEPKVRAALDAFEARVSGHGSARRDRETT